MHSVGVNSFTEFSGDECRGAGIVGPYGTGFHWQDGGLEVLAALTFWAEEEAGRVLFSETDEFEIVVGSDSEAGIAFDETVAVFTGGLDGGHGEFMDFGFETGKVKSPVVSKGGIT